MLDEEEINKQSANITDDLSNALNVSMERVRDYHKKQLPEDLIFEDDLNSKLGYVWRALESVGIYVPGGTASYPSTVIMNAIPAIVAGVEEISMVTPMTGKYVNPSVLYAAKICGIKKIFCIGGAQAIAALAYGTKTIKPVNKIVGPGNSYVASAKKEVFGDIGIESMTAGPSEVLVVCDNKSNPEWLASDLIAQAEHDSLAQCILISKDKKVLKKTKNEIINQLKSISRSSIAKKSLMMNGILIYENSENKIAEIINKVGPEHLELNIKNYKSLIPKIKNAGSICLGKYAVMAMTDYGVPGTNHVLPTNMTSKYSSGLSVSEFIKKISYINLSKKGIETLGPSVITLATNEGLDGHAKSIKKRLGEL